MHQMGVITIEGETQCVDTLIKLYCCIFKKSQREHNNFNYQYFLKINKPILAKFQCLNFNAIFFSISRTILHV